MLNALLPNLSHKYFIHQQLIHQTLSINILDRKKPLRSLSGFLCWCRQRDLNSHSLRPLPPQDSVSTNFTMSAFEKLLFLLLRSGCSRCGLVFSRSGGLRCLLGLLYVAEVQAVFVCVGMDINHCHAGCEEESRCDGGCAAQEVCVTCGTEYALRASAA